MKLVTLVLCLAIIVVSSDATATKNNNITLLSSHFGYTKKFTVYKTNATWYGAWKSCIKKKGSLAIIETPVDYEEIVRVVKEANSKMAHIGFHMIFEDPLDIDGNNLWYRKWRKDSPSANFKTRSCGSIKSTIFNQPCDVRADYVCEHDSTYTITKVDDVDYIYSDYLLTWPTARRYCETRGGYLPPLLSVRQRNDLLDFLKEKKIKEKFWIAFHNMFKSNEIVSLKTGKPTTSGILYWPIQPTEPGYTSMSSPGNTHFEKVDAKLNVVCAIPKKPCK